MSQLRVLLGLMAVAVLVSSACSRTGLDLEGDYEEPDVLLDRGEGAPDARPDGGRDGLPDGVVDGEPDTVREVGPDAMPDAVPDALEDRGWEFEREGRREFWDGDRPDRPRPDGGGEGGGEAGPDGGPACDPLTCRINCLLGGAEDGICWGDSCICRSGGDGGTTDGGTTDGGPPPPPDGGSDGGPTPDFVREGRDGMRDGMGDWVRDGRRDRGSDVSADAGTSECDPAACMETCRASGYGMGFCDPSGACTCF